MSPKPRKKARPVGIPNDVERMKRIIRQLLDRLEYALSDPAEDTHADDTQKQYQQIFGTKSSLVSILVSLAELMLKLQEASRPLAENTLPAAQLNPADMALVQAFLQRTATAQQPVP